MRDWSRNHVAISFFSAKPRRKHIGCNPSRPAITRADANASSSRCIAFVGQTFDEPDSESCGNKIQAGDRRVTIPGGEAGAREAGPGVQSIQVERRIH